MDSPIVTKTNPEQRWIFNPEEFFAQAPRGQKQGENKKDKLGEIKVCSDKSPFDGVYTERSECAQDKRQDTTGSLLIEGKKKIFSAKSVETGPAIRLKSVRFDNGSIIIEGKTSDAELNIGQIYYQTNSTKKWVEILPNDGKYDSREEQFTLKVPYSPNENISLQIIDDYANDSYLHIINISKDKKNRAHFLVYSSGSAVYFRESYSCDNIDVYYPDTQSKSIADIVFLKTKNAQDFVKKTLGIYDVYSAYVLIYNPEREYVETFEHYKKNTAECARPGPRIDVIPVGLAPQERLGSYNKILDGFIPGQICAKTVLKCAGNNLESLAEGLGARVSRDYLNNSGSPHADDAYKDLLKWGKINYGKLQNKINLLEFKPGDQIYKLCAAAFVSDIIQSKGMDAVRDFLKKINGIPAGQKNREYLLGQIYLFFGEDALAEMVNYSPLKAFKTINKFIKKNCSRRL